jgi:ABC-2 type transport system ATP-binding protein
MRARLQLARALLPKPELLILDEPTASVDPVASYELINLILRIVDESGISALVSSHRLDEIEAMGSHVILLHRGQVLYDGGLDQLRAQIDRPHYELRFRSPSVAREARESLLSASAVTMAEMIDDTNVMAVLGHGEPIGAALAGLEGGVHDLATVRELNVPLRDVLAEVYGLGDHEDSRR